MSSKTNKKLSNKSPSLTDQELAVKQLLLYHHIPFTIHQKLLLNDRYYVVDFFINNSILLECSCTTMHRVGVALKQKALQLESKFSKLKTIYPYQFWVLFESNRGISYRLSTTLRHLMPSIDHFLTSRKHLLEIYRLLPTLNQKSIHSNTINQPDFLKPKTESQLNMTSVSSPIKNKSKETYTCILNQINNFSHFNTKNKNINQESHVLNLSTTCSDNIFYKSTESITQWREK